MNRDHHTLDSMNSFFHLTVLFMRAAHRTAGHLTCCSSFQKAQAGPEINVPFQNSLRVVVSALRFIVGASGKLSLGSNSC